MTKLIDRFTGVEMWVADERVDEYLEAGYKLASDLKKPTEKARKTIKKAR